MKKQETEKRARVIRFFKSGRRKIIFADVPLSIAKLHCSSAHTKGKNWIDGFEVK